MPVNIHMTHEQKIQAAKKLNSIWNDVNNKASINSMKSAKRGVEIIAAQCGISMALIQMDSVGFEFFIKNLSYGQFI